MTNPITSIPVSNPAARPVLLWNPDRDESHVEANVEQAARFLNAPADEVLVAIEAGDLLRGWFVDWEK